MQDINIIKKIIMYHVDWMVYQREQAPPSELLKLRLVSKQWKQAVEGCNDAWTILYGRCARTPLSKHRLDIACEGMGICNGIEHHCAIFHHFTELRWFKYTFQDMFTKKRKQAHMETHRALSKAWAVVKKMKGELKYF